MQEDVQLVPVIRLVILDIDCRYRRLFWEGISTRSAPLEDGGGKVTVDTNVQVHA
jgi:hypothetical protein